jgi:hypothetical protein
MFKISQHSETNHYISFKIFNQNFNIQVRKKGKYKKEQIKPYMKELISEVQFEHFKKDSNQGKVLLFYKPSYQRGLVQFVFAVEADEYLLKLQNSNDKNKLHKMIDYLFENEATLNFNV